MLHTHTNLTYNNFTHTHSHIHNFVRRGTISHPPSFTSTFVARGRRGTNSHLPSFRVAGVALMALGGALGSGLGARDAAEFCVAAVAQTRIYLFYVAGVAQSDIHLRFTWQTWHSWHSVARLGLVWAPVTPRHFAWQAWHNLTSTFISRGTRGTNSHLPSFHVAGVALMAWGGALGSGLGARDAAPFCVAGVATLHPPSLHVAGVAQTQIYLRFTWQAWHSWHWVALLGLVWARVTPRHFAWQAWHNLTSTFVSRGRRDTNSHLPSFPVAGVTLMALGGALGSGLGARDAGPFCVAGLTQPYIHLRCTWQAWQKLTSTIVSRGRHGTHGWVARLGLVWARVTPRHFAWQAWHNLTSTFVARGRRGTNSHLPSFRVAGVSLMALGGALGSGLGARDAAAFCVAAVAQTRIYLRFTWHAWHNLTSTFVSRGRRGTHGTGWRSWVWFGRA